MTNVLAYADGTRDVAQLASDIGLNPAEAISLCEQLAGKGLLERV
jgi:phage terminase small subunit